MPGSIIMAEITWKVCVADAVSKSDSWDTMKLRCGFIQFWGKKARGKEDAWRSLGDLASFDTETALMKMHS